MTVESVARRSRPPAPPGNFRIIGIFPVAGRPARSDNRAKDNGRNTMAWDFETDPEYQKKLDWVQTFVETEVEPLTHIGVGLGGVKSKTYQKAIRPLQQKVKDMGLWACHLTPELGGQGYGQVKLALLNEKLGRVGLAPVVFGCQAPDTGNAEIISHYGTKEQKDKYLWPLLNNEITSGYSMTEPQGGSDPLAFTTRAELNGDEWGINGEKWFTSGARNAEVFVV